MPGTGSGVDVLFYAEDPAAANYLADLPRVAARRGLTGVLLAGGKAREVLTARGVAWQPGATATEVLDRWRPRVVAVGTAVAPDTLGLALVAEARRRGRPSLGLVDSIIGAAFRFRGGTADPLAFAPDLIAVPDEPTRQVFIGLGLEAGRVEVWGHPHYDHVRAEAGRLARAGRAGLRQRWLPGAPEGGPVIVFAAEPTAGFNPAELTRSEAYTLEGFSGSRGRTIIVIEEFLEALAARPDRPWLVLRLHPRDDPADYAGVADRFDLVSRDEPLFELLFAADAVVGLTSAVLVEAAILGRPTLAIVPRPVELDWLPTIRSGVTLAATTRAEIAAALPRVADRLGAGTEIDLSRHFIWGAARRAADGLARLCGRD